jgi:hypothetical protein
MKNVAIVLFSLSLTSFIFTLLQSCNKNPCGDGPITSTYSSLTSISSHLRRIKNLEKKTTHIDYYVINDIDEYVGGRYDSIALQIKNKFETKVTLNYLRDNFGAFSTAYACDYSTVGYDRVKKIMITSSEDYNDTLQSGTNLSEIILLHTNHYAIGERIEDFTRNREMNYDDLLFTFTIPPSKDMSHNINIKYFLADSTEFSTTLNNVFIRK